MIFKEKDLAYKPPTTCIIRGCLKPACWILTTDKDIGYCDEHYGVEFEDEE